MGKFKKLMVAGAAAAGLLTMQASPASAQSVGVGVFTGTATVTPGIFSPVSPTNPVCNRPFPVPPGPIVGDPNIHCPSGTGNTWAFTGTGVGVAATVPSANLVGAPLFSVNASGKLSNGLVIGAAYCGASGGRAGTGAAALTPVVGGGLTWNLNNVGWSQSAATLILFDGKATEASVGSTPNTNDIVGLVTALPTTGSCLTGTATGFTIVGASAILPTNNLPGHP